MQNCTRLVHALVSLKFRVEFLEADELLLDGTTPRRRFRVNLLNEQHLDVVFVCCLVKGLNP